MREQAWEREKEKWQSAGWKNLEKAYSWFLAGWDDPHKAEKWASKFADPQVALTWFSSGWEDPWEAATWHKKLSENFENVNLDERTIKELLKWKSAKWDPGSKEFKKWFSYWYLERTKYKEQLLKKWQDAGWKDEAEISKWMDEGWRDPVEARKWFLAGWDARWAYYWHSEGFSLESANFWLSKGIEVYRSKELRRWLNTEWANVDADTLVLWFKKFSFVERGILYYIYRDPEVVYWWYSYFKDQDPDKVPIGLRNPIVAARSIGKIQEPQDWPPKEWRSIWYYDASEDLRNSLFPTPLRINKVEYLDLNLDEIIYKWTKHFGDPEVAFKWYREGKIVYNTSSIIWEVRWLPEHSVLWYKAGWTEPQVAAEWYKEGFDPETALKIYNAGIKNPKSAKTFFNLFGKDENNIEKMVSWYKYFRKLKAEALQKWYKLWKNYNPEYVYGWYQAIRKPEEAKKWLYAGWQDPEQAGFWYSIWKEKDPEEALKWFKAGWEDPKIAYVWFSAGWEDPETALMYYKKNPVADPESLLKEYRMEKAKDTVAKNFKKFLKK